MDFKVGDKIRYIGSSDHRKDYENVVVEGVAGGPGGGMPLRIWISFNRFGARDTVTLFPDKVVEWEKVPEFFQVGKTYKSKSGHYSVKILEVYEVDNPETEGDRITAIGRVTRPDSTQHIAMYGTWEFKYHTEV